jgi:DNA-binding NarL/FixJ family response regulator
MLNVLIVAKKGELRDGLQALLAANSSLGMISVTDNLDSAVEYMSRLCPAIVVIDAESPGRALRSAVTRMKGECPQSRLLILTSDEASRHSVATYGADSVLINGVKVSELEATLEGFFTDSLV